jgi:hypothetical protein
MATSRTKLGGRRLPRWHKARRVLTLGGAVVRRLHRPADNLERVLDALQEEGWP